MKRCPGNGVAQDTEDERFPCIESGTLLMLEQEPEIVESDSAINCFAVRQNLSGSSCRECSNSAVKMSHRSAAILRVGLIVVFSLSVLLSSVSAFNLDTENCVRYRGPPLSMFGFSVAEHKELGENWVLVGAPEAQTKQPGIDRGGAVYKCKVNEDDSCQEITFDQTGNNNSSHGQQIDKKSHQWFGATVRSEDGVVVACAPRYVWFSSNLNRKDPVGTCYVAKNQLSDFSEYSPCRTRNWGYHRQGSCQAGLGASISKDGNRLFVGAVGSWYWQGQVFSQNLHTRPEVLQTLEGPKTDDDSYLGYSVAVGNFTDDGYSAVAVGMPRGQELLGKIILYSWNLTNLQNITGEQLGAYFGYSLCVSDVNGDGFDDLVIGAPLYTDLTNNEGHYENGRVYVVYQERSRTFKPVDRRDGKNSKSRFGLALTSLGDINKDGFGDFAVGAPYDGPFERGAVYIYHGSSNGVREKASQIIFSENVLPGYASTFGFSLSGGLDLDGNQYPDLIIGAYEADSAFFLRARPVVKMQSSLQFSSESKQISLEDRKCRLKDGTEVACLTLSTCLKYSGLGVDKNLDFDVQLLLDSKKPKSPRMFFSADEGKNVMNQSLRLEKDKDLFCKNMKVYIKTSFRDKLTPLEAEMRYTLRDSYAHFASSSHKTSSPLSPVLDMDDEFALVRRDSVSIQKNCGKDNVCIPDLRLIAMPSVTRYLLGSGERLYIDVLIQNEGEDSFESTFDMVIPAGMNYVNIERLDSAEKEIPVLCSPPTYNNNFTLHCDIGNPLPKQKIVHFKVNLEPFHKEGMKPSYEFYMVVNSTNPEVSTSISDNLGNLNVPIWVESDLILQGSSHPSEVHYNSTIYNSENITTEADIGPQVIHIYSIRNKGPSDILDAEAFFLWPTYTLDGDHLLYLLEQPETSGPVKCETVDKVNEEEVLLDKKRKSYLELTGIQNSLMGVTGAQHGVSQGNSFKYEETQKSSSGSTSFTASNSFNARGQNNRQKSEKNDKSKHKKYSEERKKFEESSLEYESGGRATTQNRIGGSGRVETSHSSSQNADRVRHGPIETSVATGNRLSSSSSSRTSEEEFNIQTNEGGHRVQETVSGVNFNQQPINENVALGGGYVNRSSSRNYENSFSSNRNSNAANSRRVSSGGQFETNYNRESTDVGANRGLDFNINTGSDKDQSSFHEEAKSYSANTTWDSNSGPPRTVDHSSWRTNDDGIVKNGSRSRVYTGQPNVDFGIDSNYGGVTRSSSRNYNLDLDLGNSQAGRSSSGQHYSSSNAGNHYFSGDNVDARSRSQQGYSVSETSESVSESSRFLTNEGDIWSNTPKSREKLDEERRNRANQAAKRKQDELERRRLEDERLEEERQRIEAAEQRRQEEERRRSEEFERRRYEERERQQQEEIERRRVEESERRSQEFKQKSRSSSYQSSSSYSSSSKEVEDGAGRLKLYTKYKREITLKPDEELEDVLKCGPTRCTKIRCSIGRLSKDQEGWVAFRSRVWMPTIKKIANDKEVHLSSMLAARVTKLPHVGKPNVPVVRSHEIRTQIISRDSTHDSEVVPLWVVVLSSVLGALILMLLIYCLYKCGFFKRNRPTNIPEKQPLNRNGIYQTGDEAL